VTNLLSTLTIMGLLGIALVWPVILAVWALPEARVISVATFAFAALAAALMALDTWTPGVLGSLSSGWLADQDPGPGALAIVVQAVIVAAPMLAGFAAAYRAQSRGRIVPRWLIASFLAPELLLVVGGAAAAYAWARFIWGTTYDPLALGATAAGMRLIATLAAVPATIAALLALGVTVWMTVTYDRDTGVRP
jgi:hypothetical protein